MIDFLISITNEKIPFNLSELFIHKPPIKLSISNEEIEFVAWGDPICDEIFKNRLLKQPDVFFIINNLYGHFYYLLLNKTINTVYIGNSLFGILPVYFSGTNNTLKISNNPFSLENETSPSKYNKRFLLENILFYYPLFNQSCIEDVMLLPSNHFIQYQNGKISNRQHTNIVDYFSLKPTTWRKSTSAISDLFIESSDKYFTDEVYGSSLTGGFDGRTLVACGLYKQKKFLTYSFGSEESTDVKIAESLSNKAGVEFIKIDLNENYLRNHSLDEGLDFINGSHGEASFARAHYLYTVKQLSTKINYLITGNFGSEVFRASHNAGVVISPNLYCLFMSNNFNDAVKRLEDAPEWEWINRYEFKHEWENLKQDLINLPCFDHAYKSITKNQQFYKIVFEEVFRKYFGAEIINQFCYIPNRTPFLDIDFLKGILSTGLAGVHSDFFTNNPFKRFKGQILYSNLIQRAWPDFGMEMTDKGYMPEDLMNIIGKIRIGGSYLSKKIKRKLRPEKDPFAVDAAFSVNKNYWQNVEIDTYLFNSNKLRESILVKLNNRDSLFIALSQVYYYDKKFSTNRKSEVTQPDL